MKDYRPAKKRATVTVGESVRILRELQDMSQNDLAEISGIPQADDLRDRERSRPAWCRAREGARPRTQMPSGRVGLSRMGSPE